MKKRTGEIVKRKPDLPPTMAGTPADMIFAAVSKGSDLDKLEKLLLLQERYEASQARKAYSKAFAQAQSDIQPAVKRAINTQTHSKYAKLENIIEVSKPIYTKYGFAVIFYENDSPYKDHVRICADVLHELGHKETYHTDMPLDGIGIKGNANMTAIHGKVSSSSYGRRFLMCNIWNVPTKDDDGNAASKPSVQPSTAKTNDVPDAEIVRGLKPENECHECGEIVSDAVKAYALKTYKKILCMKCQKAPR